MNFSGRTPESLLPRSDSKNPATTCKGITTAGRPCRRSLASSPNASPGPSPSRTNGVLAIVNEDNTAAFYCWQHKDQAENLAAQPEQRTTLYPLKEQSSIDTLADRVGVLNLDEELPPPKKVRHRRRRTGSDEQHLTRRDTLPSGWHDMQGPLMTVPEDVRPSRPPVYQEHRYGRSNVKASWTCCIQADQDEPTPRPRPRPQRPLHQQHPHNAYTSPSPMAFTSATHDFAPPSPSPVGRKPLPTSQPMSQHANVTLRPPQPPHSKSETQTLLSLIPTTLSPQTTSALLAELSRPISQHDEAGYIYIFWLTPSSETSKPDDETASSLLDDDEWLPTLITSTSTSTSTNTTRPRPRSSDTRRLSNDKTASALSRYASTHKPSSRRTTEPKTILLKIGRAANVHRRMTQWVRQCGLDISLVRYYPYPHHHHQHASHANSSPTPRHTPRPAPRTARSDEVKVPHVHKVERLIHLELSDKRAQKDACGSCGVVHREWFEIEATRVGLRGVDEVVRRWCGWAEGVDGTGSGGGGMLAGEKSNAWGRRRSDGGVGVGPGLRPEVGVSLGFDAGNGNVVGGSRGARGRSVSANVTPNAYY